MRNIRDPRADDASTITALPDLWPAGAAAGVWWPPVMLDPAWIAARSDSFDVMHVHFGTESLTLPHLQNVVDALATAGRPLVYTVHDLTNPQLLDQTMHEQQLDLLVSAADEVITLTDGAAAAVLERWGRRATVIAHPHLVNYDRAPRDGSGDGDGVSANDESPVVVGMHLRDLRPNIDALRATRTLLAAADLLRTGCPGLVVRIDLNDSVRDEALRGELRRLVDGVPGAALVEHPRLTDDDLVDLLDTLDVSVMPYLHGTHSGWLELCFDRGVAVAAPRIGFYSEQHAAEHPEHREQQAGPVSCGSFEPGSAHSLASAIAALSASRPHSPERDALQRARQEWRVEQRRQIHQAHLAVYRRAIASSRCRQRDLTAVGA